MTAAPLNDADISDHAELWRRIPPSQWVWDEKIGGKRPSTQAFDNSRDGSGTSVVLAEESTIEIVLQGHSGFGLAMLTAGSARNAGQGVRRVPIQGILGHAQIEGTKTKSVKKKLVDASKIIVLPEQSFLPK